ncbi:arabinogalactan endo-1,4-beta-galactosidase [Parafrankia irregularis]|uniref:Arabinogalactan endo-beta-1,4-galactanase n=1 Tax=Parafrankia irregularis TaxID=795642 RepID=A0A0S4QIX1_9ACTN|nr:MULTISPECIES: glycosyl hydrolase 53 family protein [Parafrankia]MBE3205657.1 glycosyl hydrolase 53 family protein [Parafrankia sp. CH37]CUU55443.1 arabinogalactan endo-1,4-beta-galactosidase [Parafrankia irregularis]
MRGRRARVAPPARVALPLILVVVLVVVSVLVTVLNGPGTRAAEVLGVRGADISFTLQEEAAGTALSDGGQRRSVERILAAHGANYVRLRVWVNPPAGYSDEKSALTLARRARGAGLKIMLVPHYSDFWADPHAQEPPASWHRSDLAAMKRRIGDYTRDLVSRFAAQGTPVDMIQIGNEITNGILWPLGSVQAGSADEWARLAALLNSAIAGAREGAPGRHLPVVLHVDSGGDSGLSRYFFDSLIQAGVTSFDIIGLSYYPFWNGSLAALRANLDMLASRYHREILIAETAYPRTLAAAKPGDWVSTPDQLPDGAALPATPAGQENFFAALRRILNDVPDHRGLGFFVWEPGWLTVSPKPGEPMPAANLAMFDRDGAALPGLNAFAATMTKGTDSIAH